MSTVAQPYPHILESKLRRPWVRPGIVSRAALVDRLLASHPVPVVCVVAPAGYGKTTLLSQWAEQRGRTAWVSLDERDNDPEILLACAAAALNRVEGIDPELLRTRWLGGPSIAATAVTRLAGAMSAMAEPVALVLDHVEQVSNQDCRDAVAELALHLPAGSQLAIATRDAPPLPMARLRAAREVVEVGVDDLAMDASEARGLLAAVGVRLVDADHGQLIERTEGWPVGLYLAALAIKAGGPEAAAGLRFSGDDRLMAEYLGSELLSRLSGDELSFLTRTSVLERMSGPLCDAMLGATGSAAMLESLERSNLLLVALDRRAEWYRYHHLLQDLLVAELQRREPEIVPRLHLGAAAWYEANGLPELAIDHAQAAGDTDRVARLVLEVMQPVWASGRADTVLGWMEWFEQRNMIERYPGVAVHGALIFALLGRPAKAERWAAAAERAPPTGRLSDGSTMESYLAYLRALLCRDGVAKMRGDATLAFRDLSPLSPYRAAMLHTEGLSYLLEGEPDRADPILAHAFDVATDVGALPLAAVVLAERCIVAVGRDDWPAAAALAEQALSILQDGEFEDYWTSALVYAWAARAAIHRGDAAAAREHVVRAARLRPLLTYALPAVSVQALLELARAYIALADPDGARAVLRQVSDILQQRPDLGVLPEEADELRAKVETIGRQGVGGSSLTTAELRILPLLATHLTFREIAERLYLSPYTVKTQALSVYRKFGVSSRSAAIERAHGVGVLGHRSSSGAVRTRGQGQRGP
ncbi:MAG TPA: LuxR C-terminal-related transcriptional regulator [Actinomycetota bacterium]|nr:LuxR C-terminal-related transcriptional regulator [Actinomycetota bacterium]